MTYEVRTIAISVAPKDQPIFSEQATMITLVDEGSGEYIEVSQSGRTDLGKIAINPEEWLTLRDAIEALIALCREEAK